jgi:ribosomal protein S18 acetylase RimI-like enzyme
MVPVATVAEAMETIQRVKLGAGAFATNFFPVQKKLQGWIDHGELSMINRGGAAFFFRRDRGLWHLHFCAADEKSLAQEMSGVPELSAKPMVADLVGNETALGGQLKALEAAGFRRYSRLQRMSRGNQPHDFGGAGEPGAVAPAMASDMAGVMALLEASFDLNADQLPMPYEMEAAIEAGQVLVVRDGREIAALLHFETQGLTSTVRYWAVAAAHRSRRLGSALMRRYFESHEKVRRFILWVVADNRNAIEKYQHYGYAADGLMDHVLANALIHA